MYSSPPGRPASATPPTQHTEKTKQQKSSKSSSSPRGAGERAIPLLRSCERCRRRKQRCDGEQPVCGRCKSHHAECNYRQSGRFRKRFPRSGDQRNEHGRKQMRQLSSDDTLSAATTLSALSGGIVHTPPPMTSSAMPSTAPLPSRRPMDTPGMAVPELSPCTVMEQSPNDPLVNTPISAMTSTTATGNAGENSVLGAAKNMDPVAILKAYSLPDLSQGLPEHIVRRMWALISETPVPNANPTRELSPNLELLDPRNSAANARSRLAVRDLPWLQGDPLANLDAAPSASPSPQPQHASPTETAWLAALGGVAQRHDLDATARSLLSLLQAEHEDTGLQVGARQFWATLEAGTASDFEVLAYLAVASSSGAATCGVSVEIASYEAARREWERGLVRPSTGAVCALLQLSEYGYRTGRSSVQWEFAQIAESTARQMCFRGHLFPWRSARIQMLSGKCDTEYEHLLAVFWSAWSNALVSAQVLARRLDPLPDPLDSPGVPELPHHDMCRFAARFPPRPCRHSAAMSFGAAVWRCYVIAAPVHAALMDVRESRSPPNAYFAAVDRWNTRMRLWRASWPSQWDAQMARLLQKNNHSTNEPRRHVEDAWLVHLHLVHESLRLRVHATALALLHGPPAAPGAPGDAPLSRNILVARKVHPDLRRQLWGFSGPQFDPLGEALMVHRGRFESLESVRAIQKLLELVDGGRIVRLRSLGCWIVSVLDLAIALHCGRMAKEDVDSQVDSIRRLGVLVSLLLQLRRWTAALYVFTSIVKAYVESDHLIDVQKALRPDVLRSGYNVSNSPWPANHVLTLLMQELGMSASEFCGLTLPVVYASVMSTPAMPPKMRMRIESLLS